MAKSLEKRARKPIKCWRCERYHWYRNCPQKKGRMRNVDNIQEETIVEDVGKNILRIYATLEN